MVSYIFRTPLRERLQSPYADVLWTQRNLQSRRDCKMGSRFENNLHFQISQLML